MFDIVFVFFLFLMAVTCLVYYLPPRPLNTIDHHLRSTYNVIGDYNERLHVNLRRNSSTASAAIEMDAGHAGNYTCSTQSKRLALHNECDSDMEPMHSRVRANRMTLEQVPDATNPKLQPDAAGKEAPDTRNDPSPTSSRAAPDNPPAYEVINDKKSKIKKSIGPVSNV